MTKTELKDIMILAQSPNRPKLDTKQLAIFDGFGFKDFQPVNVTKQAVAQLIRWQCLQFNGQFDNDALNDLVIAGREKFIIID